MLSITATDLPRFMACNGSVTLDSPALDGVTDTTVKDEGIAAHWLAEQVHKGMQPEELVDRQAPNGVFITGEMVEHLEDYLQFIHHAAPNIEVDTSFNNMQFDVHGRADAVAFDPTTLHIVDLKYGWSIVEPEMNWTLIAHAIGYIQKHHTITQQIKFTIYQPRPYHPAGKIRSWVITGDELIKLQSDLIRALTNPTDKLNTSIHCKNCPSLAYCPAARKAQYNAIEASEKAFTDVISNDNLSVQIDELRRAACMLKDLEKAYSELALHRLKKGEIINNFTLDKELSNRQWKEGITPEILQILTGKDLTKKQLITPAQAEKAGVSKEVVAPFTERVNKGVKLVRMDANAKAKKLFNNPKG